MSPRTTPVDVCATGAIQPCSPEAGNILTGVTLDRDSDGCTDLQEKNPGEGAEVLGGRRDYTVFWDFFDVPIPAFRDQRVSITDIFAVVVRFGSTRGSTTTKEEALAEALSTPPAPPAYHAAFDRTASVDPSQPWRTGPPSGQVSIVDISLAVTQFGHTCAV